MNIVSLLVFGVLQIAFVPLALIGILLVAYKQMVVSKRLGVSQTGIEILNGRWTMHVFGMRADAAAARLAEVIPNTSTFGLWLFLFPLWVKYKISGTYFVYPRIPEPGHERLADLVMSRSIYFDRIIERVSRDIEQFVVLGAGYDTRAYGALKSRPLRFFELDQPETQRLKIASLKEAGIDSSHVTFVEVDFAKERAFEKLEANGYDPTRKTLFLWEGVTLYLSEVDVRKTLQDIRGHAAAGSAVVADIYGERMLQFMSRSASRKALEYTNEGLAFGLPFATEHAQTLSEFIQSEGLEQGETDFMGANDPKGPFVAVVELGV